MSIGLESMRSSKSRSKQNPPMKKRTCSFLWWRLRKAFSLAKTPSGVAVVSPGMGGVAVSTDLPEPFLVLRHELDAVDPLRALPGVQLRGDHSHRASMLARQG